MKTHSFGLAAIVCVLSYCSVSLAAPPVATAPAHTGIRSGYSYPYGHSFRSPTTPPTTAGSSTGGTITSYSYPYGLPTYNPYVYGAYGYSNYGGYGYSGYGGYGYSNYGYGTAYPGFGYNYYSSPYSYGYAPPISVNARAFGFGPGY